MRREIRRDLLVSDWNEERQKKFEEESKKHRDKRKEEANNVRILKNRGWGMFYKKHRPKDMSIRDFAKEVGIHEYTISRWDKGGGSPTFRLLFDFLGWVSDTTNKPIEKVFSELNDFVELYGSEDFEQ